MMPEGKLYASNLFSAASFAIDGDMDQWPPTMRLMQIRISHVFEAAILLVSDAERVNQREAPRWFRCAKAAS